MNRKRAFLAAAVVFLAVLPAFCVEELVSGGKTVLSVPLTELENRWIKSSGLSGFDAADAAIAVPVDFNPAKTYRVLVTCVTGDRYLSNIEEMDKYWPQALNQGWVVVTGWAHPTPRWDTKAFRRAVTLAAMRKLAEIAPESRNWPVAVAGFSGGSKNAPLIAAYLQQEGYSIIGIFMGGCNRDTASWAMRNLSKDKVEFRRIPIFLSTGAQDRIATVQQSKDAVKSMRKAGFSQLRLELYPGEHTLNRNHVSDALTWFAGLDARQ